MIMGLSGCGAQTTKPAPDENVSESKKAEYAAEDTVKAGFVNEITTANVWIIADTETNRKTTLWGTATLSEAEPGKEYSVDIKKSADDHYLIRMIDIDGLYYDSESFEIKDGYSLLVCEDEDYGEPHIIIYDGNGNISEDLTMFKAAL